VLDMKRTSLLSHPFNIACLVPITYYPICVSLSTKQTIFLYKKLCMYMSLTLLCVTHSAEPRHYTIVYKNNLLLGTLENYIWTIILRLHGTSQSLRCLGSHNGVAEDSSLEWRSVMVPSKRRKPLRQLHSIMTQNTWILSMVVMFKIP
jgi:hypothetical protein